MDIDDCMSEEALLAEIHRIVNNVDRITAGGTPILVEAVGRIEIGTYDPLRLATGNHDDRVAYIQSLVDAGLSPDTAELLAGGEVFDFNHLSDETSTRGEILAIEDNVVWVDFTR